ncbi:thiolase family protein [Gordonia sp. DT30]|uniref:thiolase family protein n=1 Tax=Gordonia sp. DT30 TaxID=3416546 RepID=UPI003CF1030D
MTQEVAIAGLGLTDVGKVYGRSAASFAAEAIRTAVEDAGLGLADVDGLLVSSGKSSGVDLSLAEGLGLSNLSLLAQVNAFGASAGAMVQSAAAAVNSGVATTVVCVFADAPLRENVGAAASYSRRASKGQSALLVASGITSTTAYYALAARRHMEAFGTTSKQLGAIAVSQREWAMRNPIAQMQKPITIDDHQESRWIVEPLHLLDCCLVSNGGAAVVVTTGERARTLAQAPVYVWGSGQGHPGYSWEKGSDFGLTTGAVQSGRAAMEMAGVSVDDISIREIYDCYTYTTLVSLEDYGFCAKGEGGELASSGALGPGGSLPTNTGGGQLSSFYLWGFTPLSEAIIQARGHGGERQVRENDLVLVSGNGGILQHHSTLIVSPHSKAGR